MQHRTSHGILFFQQYMATVSLHNLKQIPHAQNIIHKAGLKTACYLQKSKTSMIITSCQILISKPGNFRLLKNKQGLQNKQTATHHILSTALSNVKTKVD